MSLSTGSQNLKDYKVIQKMNNLLKKEVRLPHETMIDHDETHIIEYATHYFSRECDYLSYPAKSYCVAIIYAHLLNFYFGEDFYHVLNDPDLLNSNDYYFKPFAERKDLYDKVLNGIQFNAGAFRLNLELSQIRSTYEYFLEEFSIENDRYMRQT